MQTEQSPMRSRFAFRKFWMATAVLLPLGCSPTESPRSETETKRTADPVKLAEVAEPKFENANEFVAAVKKANRAVLYEGLPHQFFDKASLQKEIQAKKTVTFDGFRFYQETLPLKDKDFAALQATFGNLDDFKPFSGEKKCGGFHPDYCIEWYADRLLCRVLVCFGCGEIKAFCPQSGVYCDIARRGLKDILGPYHKNRPVSKEEE